MRAMTQSQASPWIRSPLLQTACRTSRSRSFSIAASPALHRKVRRTVAVGWRKFSSRNRLLSWHRVVRTSSLPQARPTRSSHPRFSTGSPALRPTCSAGSPRSGCTRWSDATFLEDVAQEPVLRVYSDASVVLRHCTPQISREHLRQLSVVFEHQAVSEHLNTPQPPEMVPRLLPHVVGSQIALPDHEATQAFLRAGLVELRLSNPDGSGQLELRLSARGIHYLRLARDGAFG